MFDADDHRHMARALQLARLGLYTTQPNPRVGCVLVRGGTVVGEGWHRYRGGHHAEIEALQQAGSRARGATAYVTLEPCSHYGKTPPCVEALIESGVKRAVIAMTDPNPEVDGTGIQQLEAAGVEVAVGLLESQARELNPGFIRRMEGGRPHVRLKQAMSLDGRIALANGESKWITGENARLDVQRFRARSSAIMTGIGTVLSDNPAMTVRLESLSVTGEVEPHLQQPLRIVIDSRLRMPVDARMLQLPGDVLIVTTEDDPAKRKALVSDHVEVVTLPPDEDGHPDLNDLMSILATVEINELMVECGSQLAASLLAARLIDEMVLYIAPTLLGNHARGLFDLPELSDMESRPQLEILESRWIDHDMRVVCKPVYTSPL